MRTELRHLFLAVGTLGSLTLEACGGGGDSPSNAQGTEQSTSEFAQAVAPASRSYEAEGGSVGGGANIQGATNASGGRIVGHLVGVGSYLQLGVDGGVGGTASLSIRFANANLGVSRLSLYVNGVRQTQVAFASTGGWNSFSEVTVSAKLVAGTNLIRLQHDSIDFATADIDRIAVTPSSAPAPAAPAPAPAATAVLSWTAVPDTRVTGYRVYYGTASRTYLQSPGRGLATSKNTTYTVTNLQSSKKYYFAVTAVDATGRESAYSNEATKTIP